MNFGSLTLMVFTLAVLVIAGVGSGRLVHRRYRRKSLDDEDLETVGREMRAEFLEQLQIIDPWILRRPTTVVSSVEKVKRGRRLWRRQKRILLTVMLSSPADLETVDKWIHRFVGKKLVKKGKKLHEVRIFFTDFPTEEQRRRKPWRTKLKSLISWNTKRTS